MRKFFILLAVAALWPMACTLAQDAPKSDIVFLGDSNIWLAGDSCNNHQGWIAWFKDMVEPNTCRSYARSGATWSNTENTCANTEENIAVLGDNNVIFNQVLRLADEVSLGNQPVPSLIFISAGGNDAWFADKRPHEFDDSIDEVFAVPADMITTIPPSAVLSLPGAIYQCCTILHMLFPEAQLVLLTPPPMAKVEPEMLTRVSDIIDGCGVRLGLKVIRLDNAGVIDRDAELAKHVNTYDGTHTTPLGAQRVAEHVVNALRH